MLFLVVDSTHDLRFGGFAYVPPCYITGASQQINKTPLWEYVPPSC